jgi:hypothetical protein
MRTNGPFLLGASDDLEHASHIMAILSLLPRTAAPFLSGAWAERAAFSPLAWSQRSLRLTQSLPRPKPSRGGDRRQDDVVVTQW